MPVTQIPRIEATDPKRQRLLSQVLMNQQIMQEASSSGPVQSPWEGLARMGKAAVGGYFSGKAEREMEDTDTRSRTALADVLKSGLQGKDLVAKLTASGDPYVQDMGANAMLAQALRDPGETWNTLTDEEEAAMGLPTAGVYQRSTSGGMKSVYDAPKAEKPDYRAPINIGGVLYDPNDPTKIIADHSAQEIAARRANADNINMPGNPTPDEIGRGEFAKQNAAAQAKYFDNVATAGAQAQQRLGDINQLTSLIEMTPQGAGQEYLNKGAAVLSRFGVDAGEFSNVPAAQAFQSIVSRIAPTLRVAGSGATSDFEMQQFLASLPAIGNMQGGNRIIARNLKKISERSVQEAQIAAQVQGGDLTPAQGRKKILDLGPLNLDLPKFGGAPAGGPGGAPNISGGGFAPSPNDPLGIRKAPQ